MSDSVRPHRRQPSRIPHPWDSPGKNTGVGCHFLLQCMKVKSKTEVSPSVVSDSSRPHGLQHTRLLCPWDFPGKNTGVGCLLQGIFPTQGSNLCLMSLALAGGFHCTMGSPSLYLTSIFFFFFLVHTIDQVQQEARR